MALIINGTTVNPETVTANGHSVNTIKVIDTKHDYRSQIVWPEPMNLSITITETSAQVISTAKYHWRYIIYVNGTQVADIAANNTANVVTAGTFGSNNVITVRVYRGYASAYYDYSVGEMPLGTRIIQFVEVPEKITVSVTTTQRLLSTGRPAYGDSTTEIHYESGTLYTDSCPSVYAYIRILKGQQSYAAIAVNSPDWTKDATIYSYVSTYTGNSSTGSRVDYDKNGVVNESCYVYAYAALNHPVNFQSWGYSHSIITDAFNQEVNNGDVIEVPYTHIEFNLY